MSMTDTPNPDQETVSPHGGGVISQRLAVLQPAPRVNPGAPPATPKYPAPGSGEYEDQHLRLQFYGAANGDLDAAKAAYEWATGKDVTPT